MRTLAEGRAVESERAIAELEPLAAMIDDPALQVSLSARAGMRAMQLHDHDYLRRNIERIPKAARALGRRGAPRARVRRDAREPVTQTGFWDGASHRLGALLLGRDVAGRRPSG